MKLVQGIGINDADYEVSSSINGYRICPYYQKWKHMLMRAYSDKYKKDKQTYLDVTVCEEWHLFSNFKAWMETQDWEGKQLDKDILVFGNKTYSPSTCCFVSNFVNTFVSENGRGDLPAGVVREKTLFRARVRYNGKLKSLGYFKSAKDAHIAWVKSKLDMLPEIIKKESLSPKVSTAIEHRFKMMLQEAEND